ncbi:N-acetylmuramoyl-L-alanine amidase [Leisingera aquaemixtae]|uniref:N-acetylmuramoyl-L-alanine amidase n=1 Tax=Leisingera aquaemixtae TaxID=1396826 RepID=UPI001C97D60C|nr:N-acetylmuramoyl-L-alanine amidase [Leisingera aquaemixtae]MBY6066966.1 N-acetylmuramoyl-L-alanine amidase [Leisingera aquaemixtae]
MTADQPGAVWHPSPNFGPRRDGLTPSLIVLHYTAMDSAAAALDRLCDPAAEVSAHYLIGADGGLWQMVAEDSRAWHAGAGEWAGQADINSRSIGIELDNHGTHPFSEPQMAALEALMRGIMQRRDIPPAGVIGHSCMAPGRKCDPGPRFDWARLARLGLAAGGFGAPQPQSMKFEDFRQAAAAAGFTAPADDRTLLAAVRLRFRPWARGPLSAEDFLPLHPLVR